ncbi:MAG: DUF2938 family protein [Gammaproteobacteria bacterium]
MEQVIQILFVGAFATLAIDICAELLKRGLHKETTDWALVGRWFAGLPRGMLVHRPIGNSPQIKYEKVIGWGMHYIIGVVYAGMYLVCSMVCFAARPWHGSVST